MQTITAEGFSPLHFYLFNDGKAAKTVKGTMEFTFEGNSLEILGYKSKNRGIFEITIDGGETERVSCYDDSFDTWFDVVYTADNLGDGIHTVWIKVKGEKAEEANGTQVAIDAIRTFG